MGQNIQEKSVLSKTTSGIKKSLPQNLLSLLLNTLSQMSQLGRTKLLCGECSLKENQSGINLVHLKTS